MWGAFGVTLHGRSREQRYLKHADWQYIYECANISDKYKLEFIGNGDIFSYNEWNTRISRNDKMSTCMIGRGALIKPWIFTGKIYIIYFHKYTNRNKRKKDMGYFSK